MKNAAIGNKWRRRQTISDRADTSEEKIECQHCQKWIKKEFIWRHQLVVHKTGGVETTVRVLLPPPHVEKVLRWLTTSLSPPAAHQLRLDLPPRAFLLPRVDSDTASVPEVTSSEDISGVAATATNISQTFLPPPPTQTAD